ncbi:MAG TPA: histidine kinase, partial [Ruminiclostridium sp.]|nr:histidine kinase [Ruminiclostridium sp.]
MIDRIDELINELYKAKIVHQQTQIKALKAQINPHFLYNTLETISSIAKIRKVKEISSIAQGLSSMFRYSIKTGSDVVRLSSEIGNVKNYLSILKIRFEDKLDYEFSIPEELNHYKIYKLILQPIVENAVHHGIELKKEGGLIKVDAALINNRLHITISDNGVGIEEAALTKIRWKLSLKDSFMDEKLSEGIGMSNVNARLALYYKENFQFKIDSIYGEGTVVEIIIPAELYEEDSNV